MKSGSWASYQSALPIEAGAGGEPDGDEPEGKPDWPVGYGVEWFVDVAVRDAEFGVMTTMQAPVGRWFPVLTTGGNAYRAAKRFAAVMARRHGHATVAEEMFRGETWHETVTTAPPEPPPF